MTEFVSEAFLDSRAAGVGNLNFPVHTPDYQYLVCDLLTDELWASPAFTNVRFERRVSRPGSFSGQLNISNRAQAQQADSLSLNCGRIALWILRNKQLWWGGILWNAAPAISARDYDTVQFQGSSFESYPFRRHLDQNWAMDPAKDMAHKVIDIWNVMQGVDVNSDIGVIGSYANVPNLANNFYPAGFKASDLTYYGDMIQKYTDDPVAGVDYTIDVYHDEDGNRIKQAKVAGDFRMIPNATPLVISGYRIPSWGINRDSAGMGNNFQVWVNAQSPNSAEDSHPLGSQKYKNFDLLNAGWPRLDVREQLDGEFTWGDGFQRANFFAKLMAKRSSGIQDVVSYEVDLSDSAWHPNLIGQNVTIKHSKNDLWYPGETRVVSPVVAEFTPPSRGSAESVKFTFNNTAEGVAV